MGLKGCTIELDNPWNTYYAGQTVNGVVKFTFDSPKKVRGIIIRFLGEANTNWEEQRSSTNNDGQTQNETIYQKGNEEYLRLQYYLLGNKNGDAIELSSGVHEYPFTCTLPPVLPSSFEGEYGHIRYTIKITLDRPWKFDQDMKMAFTVITPVDLNVNPRVKEPFKLELEKSFCCLCCRSGPLTVITFIPVTGYVSGQLIPVTCECDNASNVAINSVNISLMKCMTFRTTEPRVEKKETNETLFSTTVGPIEKTESKCFNVELQIPPVPPTNLNCSIISLDYCVQVECVVSGPHQNLKGKLPITIGTMPLSSVQASGQGFNTVDQNTFVNQSTTDAKMGGAVGWNIRDGAGNGLHSNIPRPEFSEGEFKTRKITDGNDSENTIVVGVNNFAPRYPTLPMASPSAPPYSENY